MKSDDQFSLEIAILSFNKSEMTLALLESLRKFEETENLLISILDQGSRPTELENLERNITDSRIRLVKSHINLRVGGGREKQLNQAERKWILFLDNDLVFNSTFVKECASTALLTSFACLPFIESSEKSLSKVVTPALFRSEAKDRQYGFSAGLGSASESFSAINFPQQITAVAGGVFLANVEALKNLGGIRGPGKAGYEDLDISLRIERANKPILLIPIRVPLTHNKTMIDNEIGRETEIARLNPYELRANARFVEQEFKVHVWGRNQYEWLTQRAIQSNVEEELIRLLVPNVRNGSAKFKKPKVLLICDAPGWAFDRIAQQQKTHLSANFDIVITYSNNWESMKCFLFEGEWAAVIFLWRAPLFQLVRESLLTEDLLSKVGYCVYDHQGDLGYESEIQFLENRDTPIGVVNQTLANSLALKHQNVFLIPDGVDTGLFKPFKSKARNSDTLVIGWSGNTKWGGTDDVKGFSRILKPTIEKFSNESEKFTFDIMDSSKGRIPHTLIAEAMKKWDVVVCVSKHEGTPNPVLEGLASGIVVVSTPVGMTSELNAKGAKIRIISESAESLYGQIKEIFELKQSGLLANEKKLNREVSIKYDWRSVLNHHRSFIHAILERGRE